MSANADWLASSRGRVGYLVAPTVLAYATGGAAWGRIDYAANAVNPANGYAAPVTASNTRSGYVVGGGLEWAMTDAWSVRAEYLNYRFDGGPNLTGASAVFPTLPSGYSWGNTRINVARAGVSYKF
jgi:outer membrane immunogenic protein